MHSMAAGFVVCLQSISRPAGSIRALTPLKLFVDPQRILRPFPRPHRQYGQQAGWHGRRCGSDRVEGREGGPRAYGAASRGERRLPPGAAERREGVQPPVRPHRPQGRSSGRDPGRPRCRHCCCGLPSLPVPPWVPLCRGHDHDRSRVGRERHGARSDRHVRQRPRGVQRPHLQALAQLRPAPYRHVRQRRRHDGHCGGGPGARNVLRVTAEDAGGCLEGDWRRRAGERGRRACPRGHDAEREDPEGVGGDHQVGPVRCMCVVRAQHSQRLS